MITEFKVKHFYKFTGKAIKNRNPSGEMDFMLDGMPHQCIAIKGSCCAAFSDSPAPHFLWNWKENMKYMDEVGIDK